VHIEKPLISVVAPVFNEAAILKKNVNEILAYFDENSSAFRWELIIVNDGSVDRTSEIADSLQRQDKRIFTTHHRGNRGVGEAIKTGVELSRGEYVVTIDIDLSYSPDHIGTMIQELINTDSNLVLASPYMEGGALTNVPRFRRVLSIWANRFLKLLAHGDISTITSMVRAYDGPYIRSLALRATGLGVLPETVYKTMILRGRIAQIPAHLDWSAQVSEGVARRSSMQVLRQIISTLMAGFLFRPFMFFVLPGLVLFVFASWVNTWMFIHFIGAYNDPSIVDSADRISAAVAFAYQQYPHTFIVGLLAMMLAIQLLSLGILALQSKNYFEEIFHLGASLRRDIESSKNREGPPENNL